MTFPELSTYFLAAFAGGAINSVAGGGTFLTFPVLIWNGLSALDANIMSTIALWPGSVSSAVAYRRQLDVDKKRLVEFLTMSLIGSAIGTAILLLTPEATFSRLVPWLLLVATLIFTFGRPLISLSLRERAGVRVSPVAPPSSGAARHLFPGGEGFALILQFIIAVYGGYFGAGIGILMLAMLQVLGLVHIHRMNALKTVLGTSINAMAVVIFIFSGRVIWPLAVIMIAGAILGGAVGARLALKISPRIVRAIVSVIGFAMTAYFFMHGA